MNRLGITSQKIYLLGSIPRKELRRLDSITSYRVKGFQFSEAYRDGRWDGKIHLLKLTSGGATLPFGLHDEATRFLRRLGDFKVIDKRVIQGESIDLDAWPLDTYEPRHFQDAAVDAVFNEGLGFLHGTIRSPVRSGKTIMQAKIVHRYGKKAVVLVGSTSAVQQTFKVFRNVFGKDEVGVYGLGYKTPRSITIASVQSTTLNPTDAKRLFDGVSLVLIDEFHHYTKSGGRKKKVQSWKDFVEKLDVPYKIGFSGTIYFDDKNGSNEEDIWLRAIAGPIVFSISMRELIDQDYLVEPTVYFIPFKETLDAPNYQSAYKELLENERRNRKIVEIAGASSDAGHKVIIVTNRITQAEILGDVLTKYKIRHAVLTGPSKLKERTKCYRAFCKPSSGVNVLVGTVFGETIDLPPATIVINACGGSSRGGTIQKLRNMTPHPGKEKAIVFDFADVNNRHFKKHSRERRNHYRAEGLTCSLLRSSSSVGEVL